VGVRGASWTSSPTHRGGAPGSSATGGVLRVFDPTTQRSIAPLRELTVLPLGLEGRGAGHLIELPAARDAGVLEDPPC
jgi:hypothetical protein